MKGRFRKIILITAFITGLSAFSTKNVSAEPPEKDKTGATMVRKELRDFENLQEVINYFDPRRASELDPHQIKIVTKYFESGGKFEKSDIEKRIELRDKVIKCRTFSSDRNIRDELQRLKATLNRDLSGIMYSSVLPAVIPKQSRNIDIIPRKIIEPHPEVRITFGQVSPALRGLISPPGADFNAFLTAVAKTFSQGQVPLTDADKKMITDTLLNSIKENPIKWGPLSDQIKERLKAGDYAGAVNIALTHPEIKGTGAIDSSLDRTTILYPDKLAIFSAELGWVFLKFNEETRKNVLNATIHPDQFSVLGDLCIKIGAELWRQEGIQFKGNTPKDIIALGAKLEAGIGGNIEFYRGPNRMGSIKLELRGNYLYIDKIDLKRGSFGGNVEGFVDITQSVQVGGRVSSIAINISNPDEVMIATNAGVSVKVNLRDVPYMRIATLFDISALVLKQGSEITSFMDSSGTVAVSPNFAPWLRVQTGLRVITDFNKGGTELSIPVGFGFELPDGWNLYLEGEIGVIQKEGISFTPPWGLKFRIDKE